MAMGPCFVQGNIASSSTTNAILTNSWSGSSGWVRSTIDDSSLYSGRVDCEIQLYYTEGYPNIDVSLSYGGNATGAASNVSRRVNNAIIDSSSVYLYSPSNLIGSLAVPYYRYRIILDLTAYNYNYPDTSGGWAQLDFTLTT